MWFFIQSYCTLTEIGLGARGIIGDVKIKQGDDKKEEFMIMNLDCSEEKCI